MSLEHMLRDEEELLKLFLQEAEREGEFEMSIGYQPNGSNYHDHRCTCPGCNYDGPEPTEQEILQWTWNELQAVPSYVEVQAAAWAAETELEVEV